MSLMRLGYYRELGLRLFLLGEYHSQHSKWPPMVDEKRDDRVKGPIKLLFEEALT